MSAETSWGPLTERQRLMWLEHELHPDVPSSHMIATFRIAAAIDGARFADAWAQVVASSDALRSVFARVDGQPRRRVRDDLEGTLLRVDLSRLSDDPDGAAQEWITRRKQRPFALDERAFDAALLRLGPESFVWYLGLHHLVTDAASFALVYRRTVDTYLGGSVPDAPSYEAWVAERSQREASEEHTRAESFWRARLLDPPPPLRLYGRPRAKSPFFVRHTVALGARADAMRHVVHALTRAAPTDASLATCSWVLAAAWLARVTGNRRLGLGAPMANRPHRPARETVGAFLEVAPLRVELDEAETFASLFAKVRRELFAVLPFSRHTVSNPSHAPAFEAMVNHHVAQFPARIGPTRTELTTGVIDVPHELRTKRDLAVGPEAEQVVITAHDFDVIGATTLWIDLREDLLEDEHARAAIAHFERILDAFVEDPHARIDGVPLVSVEERRRLLEPSRRACEPTATSRTVVDLFFESVARSPESVAVVHRDRETSYRALADATLTLAARLEASGVRSGDHVVVRLERTTETLVALLAILRVGAAYVPIDPTHPAHRSTGILEDAGARTLVTSSTLGSIDGFEGTTVFVDVRDDDGVVESVRPAPHVRALPPTPDDLAYVLFTSGSTGRPKGVAIEHRAFASFLQSMAHEPGLEANDRLLAITTLGFDIAGLELFLPLVVGATVEIADRELAVDADALLARLVRAPHVTTLQATPATWRMLVEAGLPRTELRALVGGEAFPRALAAALLPRVRELWNLYGPTETTVWSTLHRVCARDLEGELPIGHPIAGTRIYVLDEAQQLLPAGVVGELWIGGVGVARGYLDRPELTAKRFVEDPFVESGELQDGELQSRIASASPRARMYRTGDLASLDHDGILHYHGRVDRQIKLRGFRIEPGEIEHTLCRHPLVRAAVVRVREAARGPRLEAFVQSNETLVPSELATFARAHLPDYMVPTSFVALVTFPLSPSGKVDFAALPIPEDDDALEPVSEGSYEPPSDDLEVLLASIFSELLGVAKVGRDDDFFALGGHSLLALRLARRVQNALGLELGVARVLQARNVASLATAIRSRRTTPPSIVPLVASSRPDVAPIFFVCGIQLYHELAERLGPELPSYGLFAPIEEEVIAALDAGRPPPKLTVHAMAEAYVALLSPHRHRGPFRLAGVSFGGVLAFEVASLLRARGDDVALVVLLDSLLPSARRRSWLQWARNRWDAGLDVEWARTRALRALQRVWGRLRRSERSTTSRETPHDVEALREQLYLEAIEAWDRQPQAPYDGRVLVVRAAQRHEDASDVVAPDLGWRARVRGPLEVVEVPGDHLGIVRGPSAIQVADEIRRRL